MPLDLNKRQSIEEITNGRIKKVPGEEGTRQTTRRRMTEEAAPDTGRKGTGRSRSGK